MSSVWKALRRRLIATRGVWTRGGAHMAMLEAPAEPAPREPEPRQERDTETSSDETTERSREALGSVDLPPIGSLLDREPVAIRGWTLFPAGPASRVDVWFGDTHVGQARLGVHRHDVFVLTGRADGAVAGWELVVDLGKWPGRPGKTTYRVRATGPEGEVFDPPAVPVRVVKERERPRLSGPVGVARPTAAAASEPAGARASAQLRVLVMTHQLDLGGAQLYLLDLLRELRGKRGMDLTVVSPIGGPLAPELERLGIPVHISSPMPLDDADGYDGRVEELVAWARPGQFDVAFLNTALAFPGADVAAALGIPAVWSIHESYDPAILWWMYGSRLDTEVRQRAEAGLANAAAAIFEADATRRLYEPYLGDGRCVTLPYGIEFAALDDARRAFDRNAARRERGIPKDDLVVVCVGTIEPRKAQVPLAQAFAEIAADHPRARLVFVGARDDADSQVLERYATTCGPAGRIDVVPVTPDIWPWYGLADLFVCASDVESLPRSVIEAMAWGTPVLATSVFGLPDLIEHDVTGWLCAPRDVHVLADALDSALSADDAARRRVGRAGQELVRGRHQLAPCAAATGDVLAETRARIGAMADGHSG